MRAVSVASCLFGILSCGCSLLFVSGPPKNAERIPPSEPLECTTSKLAPGVDTAVAAYQVFRTGYALSRTSADYAGQPINQEADIGFGLGLTALFAASAVYGYVTTGKCAQAKVDHSLRSSDLEKSPVTFKPNRPSFRPAQPRPATAPPLGSAAAQPPQPAEAVPAGTADTAGEIAPTPAPVGSQTPLPAEAPAP